MTSPESFEHLLRAAQDGEEPAIERLHADLHPALVRYLRAFEPGVAEELAGDVWLGVALGIRAFAGGRRDFRAWLFTIARRRLRELRGSGSQRRAFAAEPAAGTYSADVDGGVRASRRRDALGLIATLSPADRDVLLLRALAELSLEEIGIVLAMRPAAARNAERRGLAALAAILDRQEVPAW